MTGDLSHLAAALALFVGWHLVVSGTPLRDALVARLGEGPFRGLFSVIALGSLVWAIFAYNAAPYVELWVPPAWAPWLAICVMPIAFVLLACGVTTRNPTSIGMEAQAHESDPMPGIGKVTRHPVMWAMALWGLAHIPANGDAAALMLMGAIAFLALAGMRSMDAKQERRLGAAWGPIAMTTSALPFAALLAGRNRVTVAEIGWWRIGLGLALYAATLALHPWLFGVSPLPA